MADEANLGKKASLKCKAKVGRDNTGEFYNMERKSWNGNSVQLWSLNSIIGEDLQYVPVSFCIFLMNSLDLVTEFTAKVGTEHHHG